MMFSKFAALAVLVVSAVKAQTYTLNYTYDHSNWYTSWTFEDGPDPTHGFVEYQNLSAAQDLGLTKIIGNQVYMGVDNSTVISSTSTGRKSIWLESTAVYEHYLLIADFEHMPGSDCGTWPGFWSINQQGYGEIDIVEGANQQSHNCMTLHTKEQCSFTPRNETGTTNGIDCALAAGDGGCDTTGGQYGTGFNNVGGGVYATLWNSGAIQVFFWERVNIPSDITCGDPKPETWGVPLAQFAGALGGCDIDANFQAQTLYFDTTFCGANAGGEAWTTWSTCSQTTGYSTCEEYVAARPEAFDDAYWLVNYVKVFMETSSASPSSSPAAIAPSSTSSVQVESSIVPVTSSTIISSHITSSTLITSSTPIASSTPIIVSKPSVTNPKASPSATMKVSINGSCGSGVTCEGSSFGNCCSSFGYCGSDADYCGTGCQSAFGSCPKIPFSTVTLVPYPHPSPSPPGLAVSDYGNCGESIQKTCKGSPFGNCCSTWGFCGSDDAYCGKGCQSNFGTCS